MNRRGFLGMLGLGSLATLIPRQEILNGVINTRLDKLSLSGHDQGYKFRGLSPDNPIDIHPMDFMSLVNKAKVRYIDFAPDGVRREKVYPVNFYFNEVGEAINFHGIWYRQTTDMPAGSFYF